MFRHVRMGKFYCIQCGELAQRERKYQKVCHICKIKNNKTRSMMISETNRKIGLLI